MYLSASRRTTILAEGVLLYARLMDTNASYSEAWERWKDANGKQMSDAVTTTQYRLFDVANAIGHSLGQLD